MLGAEQLCGAGNGPPFTVGEFLVEAVLLQVLRDWSGCFHPEERQGYAERGRQTKILPNPGLPRCDAQPYADRIKNQVHAQMFKIAA